MDFAGSERLQTSVYVDLKTMLDRRYTLIHMKNTQFDRERNQTTSPEPGRYSNGVQVVPSEAAVWFFLATHACTGFDPVAVDDEITELLSLADKAV